MRTYTVGRRAAEVGLILALLLAAMPIAASADESQPPIGYHDGPDGELEEGQCSTGGWAVDPDSPATRLTVRISVDGTPLATVTADQFRQDLVDAGVSPDGYSGFSIDLRGQISPLVPHVILAEAQDLGTDDWHALVDTPRTITCANSAPTGTHDGFAERYAPFGHCFATGWAVDPDAPTTRLNVRISVDGIQLTTVVANVFRQDLLDAGASPDGFSSFFVYLAPLGISFDETHTVLVEAQDADTGDWFPLELTPRTLTCTNLDSNHDGNQGVVARGDCVASGWAVDQDTPNGPRVQVRVKVDGKVVAETTADAFRQDLLDLGFGDGFHGWSVNLFGRLTPGVEHIVTVEARDTTLKRVWLPVFGTGVQLTCLLHG